MRQSDVELLEEALGASARGTDFDEALLRTLKRHLPVKYHRRFAELMDEILSVASEGGLTNREAAMQLLTAPRASGLHAGLHAEGPGARGLEDVTGLPPPTRPREPSGDSRHAGAEPVKSLGMPAAPALEGAARSGSGIPETHPSVPKGAPETTRRPPATGPEEEGTATVGETPGAAERLPEVENILDLGGAAPDQLPPEMRDKLKRVVKVKKREPAWEEGPEEEPDPRLFFKGSLRAPPQLIPREAPVQKEAGTARGEGKAASKKPAGSEGDEDGGPARESGGSGGE
ncbi:MAG: hypothetical protein QW379_03790 [Thermoplasmata archaeon]